MPSSEHWLTTSVFPPATAIIDYAIGRLEKLSWPNGVFRWCPNGSHFLTYNSNYIRVFVVFWFVFVVVVF